MFIKEIQLQNFQTIKEFKGNFEGDVYLVTGENEIGKSTLLKALMVLLTGNRDEVLRMGEDKGFGRILVGGDGKEYQVELRFTKANPRGTLTIQNVETGERSDTLTSLHRIFGYQDFDANEFASWSDTAEGRRKQVSLIKSLLPENVLKRIIEIDNEVESTKESRKGYNSLLKKYKLEYDKASKGLTAEDIDIYDDEYDMQELMENQKKSAELEAKAATVREKLAEREQTLQYMPKRIEQENQSYKEYCEKQDKKLEQVNWIFDRRVKEIEQSYQKALKEAEEAKEKALKEAQEKSREEVNEISDAKKKAKQGHEVTLQNLSSEEEDAKVRRDNCKTWLKTYEENKPADITSQMQEAQHHNEMHRKVAEYKTADKNYSETNDTVQGLEDKILKLSTEKEKLIKESSLPIPGLSFSEDGLVLNGVPFVAGKVSDSQIMEVAAKIVIAKNPTVKVFRIARGESLGKKRLEALVDFARKEGFQGFIENVVRNQEDLRVEKYEEI